MPDLSALAYLAITEKHEYCHVLRVVLRRTICIVQSSSFTQKLFKFNVLSLTLRSIKIWNIVFISVNFLY